MAFEIKIAPKHLTPVYNNVVTVVHSDNITQDNYNYIFDLKDTSGNRLSRLRIPADPNGYGVFDSQRILESQVKADVIPSLIKWSAATNSFAGFSVEYGEEFTSYFNFSDNYFASGNVGFTSLTKTHIFQVGDEVFIEQNPTGATNSQYNGVHTVVSVPNAYSVVIDVPFGSSTPAEAGTMVYSDFRPYLFTAMTSSTGNYVVNGALSHQDFRTYNSTDFQISTAFTGSLLTSMPNGWTIDEDTQAYMLAHQFSGSNMKHLHVYLSNGLDYRITNNNPSTKNQAVGVGSWNINNAGFGSIINSSINSYTAFTEDVNQVRSSQNVVFNVYHPCQSRYEQVQIIGMDRLGSMVGFNFDLLTTQKSSIKRSEISKLVGDYNPSTNQWGFNSYDRKRVINNIDVTDSFTVTSDFISQEMVQYLSEIYSSPEVFVIDSNNEWKAIIVTDSSFNYKTRVKDKLISYEMTFEYAYNNQIQRGF